MAFKKVQFIPRSNEPRIIIFDFETMPEWVQVLKYFTGLSQYPGKTLKAQINTIICCGWKVFGEYQTHCLNVWDYSKDINDDKKLCQEIYKVLSTADAVVTHNGKRFDWKFLQTRLIKHGLKPMSKTPHIDTCQLARSNLFAINNRLQTLSELIGKKGKMATGGWKLWEDVYNDVGDSRAKMTKYCKWDVKATEEVFKPLRPFANNIPNYNKWTDLEGDVCPKCGGTKIIKWGWRHTQMKVYQRYKCNNCGSDFRTDIRDNNARSI